jgi:uncharacterized protein YbcC (UPF0753/DUF2309 family)
MTSISQNVGNSQLHKPEDVEREILQLAELLPLQGPITSFAFLNPLQGMENCSVFDTLRQVSEIYGCQPYLSESAYRSRVESGRITESDLTEIVKEDCCGSESELVGGLTARCELRVSQALHLIAPATEYELKWALAEADSLRTFDPSIRPGIREKLLKETQKWIERPDSPALTDAETSTELLGIIREVCSNVSRRPPGAYEDSEWEAVCLQLIWRIVKKRLVSVPVSMPTGQGPCRLRDSLLELTGRDCDDLVNEILVGFCAAFLDQGYAQWQLPDRDKGFMAAFCSIFRTAVLGTRRWLHSLPQELELLQNGNLTALQSLCDSLDAFGISVSERKVWLRKSLLALRGWAGMLWQTEIRPDRVYRRSPPGTLIEFLAVRLILDRLAAKHTAAMFPDCLPNLKSLRCITEEHLRRRPVLKASNDFRAFVILQLAQRHGWSPEILYELPEGQWQQLTQEIEAFDSLERRRVFQLAFERHLLTQTLDAISIRSALPLIAPKTAKFQVVTCIDAREESFRRHLEEVCPAAETFGNAGFFCVPMYYRGAAEAAFTALCPVVITPKNWIVEDVVYALEDSHRQRAAARRMIGRASQRFEFGSRSSLSGALLTAVLGPLATAPLLGRILFPRFAARMHSTAQRFVAPPAITRLRLERPEGIPAGPHEEGIGFTLSEMVTMSERSLRDIGLTSDFASLVLFLGHGSTCLNNPHESAYHCGACSGSPGGANARALAAMLNDLRVRRQLRERGLEIPEGTWFIGGLHNTATEAVTFFDLELLPSSHVAQLRAVRSVLSKVAERNAHERCRRFEAASLDIRPADALVHVQERSEDLAQTRPEYGNCTNAICFVGRRSRIRGLYLDRRSFMMSYDKLQDTPDHMILARILGAVIPVCEGINLLYTLSAMDNHGWGSGTKLPHNVTSLLGVMDGAASDLRPGLPWQGVDIHEPVRLLFVVETTPEAMLHIMDRNPNVAAICRNGWAQLAVLDPKSSRIQRFVNGGFEEYTPRSSALPEVASSTDWYRGRRDHLPFAIIGDEAPQGSPTGERAASEVRS